MTVSIASALDFEGSLQSCGESCCPQSDLVSRTGCGDPCPLCPHCQSQSPGITIPKGSRGVANYPQCLEGRWGGVSGLSGSRDPGNNPLACLGDQPGMSPWSLHWAWAVATSQPSVA